MISFTVITSTPQLLANFLVSRNILQPATDQQGGTIYVGVNPGMEWVEVPNPIQTDPGSGTPGQPGYVPPTFDNRHVYLVKFSQDSEANETAGANTAGNQYDWSKFGTWVKNNSSVVAAPANYLIQGQPAGNAYKITGQNVWLVRDGPERFGVWQ